MFQHIFWFFGHPEVYIMILPAFGIVSRLSHVCAQAAVRVFVDGIRHRIHRHSVLHRLGASHVHCWHAVTGQPFFMYATMMIAVPTGVKCSLDRNHVARFHDLRNPHAVCHRLHFPCLPSAASAA